MTDIDELRELGSQLDRLRSRLARDEIESILHPLEEVATEIGKSWSGSWFGYHSRVYYKGLAPPPPGAHFSPEWGFMGFTQGTTGEWQEYDFDVVRSEIFRLAGNPDLAFAEREASAVRREVESRQSEIQSVLEALPAAKSVPFIERLLDELRNTRILTAADFIRAQRPSGTVISRDSLALTQGLMPAPHLTVLADVVAIRHTVAVAEKLAGVAAKAASHLERLSRRQRADERVGTSVFIGHGRSRVWKDLRDFLQDRLRLPWDEFNRVPVAGVTNIARLSEMLDAAALAFVILTAEDEQADGEMHARMNAIHEAGLFQGRLGFGKAIVVLEDGCREFSNIHGLGQIRFPHGNISASFEEIRRVLEREGLLDGP